MHDAFGGRGFAQLGEARAEESLPGLVEFPRSTSHLILPMSPAIALEPHARARHLGGDLLESGFHLAQVEDQVGPERFQGLNRSDLGLRSHPISAG